MSMWPQFSDELDETVDRCFERILSAYPPDKRTIVVNRNYLYRRCKSIHTMKADAIIKMVGMGLAEETEGDNPYYTLHLDKIRKYLDEKTETKITGGDSRA